LYGVEFLVGKKTYFESEKLLVLGFRKDKQDEGGTWYVLYKPVFAENKAANRVQDATFFADVKERVEYFDVTTVDVRKNRSVCVPRPVLKGKEPVLSVKISKDKHGYEYISDSVGDISWLQFKRIDRK
jgi:hypothetical protein